MKRAAFNHPKLLRLAKLLDVPHYAAVGVVESLWHFAGNYAPAGDVGKWTNTEIADAIGWPSADADRLLAALTDARLVDEHPEHRLMIHDWSDHCEDAIHMALARKREWFADGRRPSLGRLARAERERIEADFEKLPPRQTHGAHTYAHKNALPSPPKPSPPLPSQAREGRAKSASAKSASADAPSELLALVDFWNGLGKSIVKSKARRDPPSDAVLGRWRKSQREHPPELKAALRDLPALEEAIRRARFCHGKGWFRLTWLFGSKGGEWNLERLLDGAYDDVGTNGSGAAQNGQSLARIRGQRDFDEHLQTNSFRSAAAD